jgi:oligoendopeptidase F
MASVAELAQRFDIDVEAPEFWNGALGLMEQRVTTYEALVERFKGGS